MKKYIATIIAASTLLALVLAVNANAATTGDAYINFNVLTTQEINAANLSIGNVSAGNNSFSSSHVNVKSNVAWKVTAKAQDNFKDTGNTVVIPASNLTLGGNAMSTTTAVQIMSGAATSGTNPVIAGTLSVPWDADVGGKIFQATFTYEITPI